MAAACGTPIVFDPTARSPRFSVQEKTARSIRSGLRTYGSWGAKLELVRELGFAGIGVWQINPAVPGRLGMDHGPAEAEKT